MENIQRVLVLGPHTDDGAFGCGGTIVTEREPYPARNDATDDVASTASSAHGDARNLHPFIKGLDMLNRVSDDNCNGDNDATLRR